jgi:hypothetical protein
MAKGRTGVNMLSANDKYGKTTVSKVQTNSDGTNRVSGKITKRVQPS